MKHTGFTLIEILVVVSIIGILVAFLSINITGIRERAADAKLKNKLEQFMIALRAYYSDEKKYPETGGPANAIAITGPSSIYMKETMSELKYYNRLKTHDDGAGNPVYDSVVGCVNLSPSSEKDIKASQAECYPSGIDASLQAQLILYGCPIETCYCQCVK